MVMESLVKLPASGPLTGKLSRPSLSTGSFHWPAATALSFARRDDRVLRQDELRAREREALRLGQRQRRVDGVRHRGERQNEE